jgi:hypothetical protein
MNISEFVFEQGDITILYDEIAAVTLSNNLSEAQTEVWVILKGVEEPIVVFTRSTLDEARQLRKTITAGWTNFLRQKQLAREQGRARFGGPPHHTQSSPSHTAVAPPQH